MANPQSGYNPPDVIPLRGGLDLQAARFAVTPGTLQDCWNYETFGISGYSVIEGIEPYDGTLPCFIQDCIYATRNTGAGNFTLGENLTVSGKIFGRCVNWNNSDRLGYLLTDIALSPNIGDTITGTESGATLTTSVGGIRRASKYYSVASEFLDARDDFYDQISADKQNIFPYVSYSQNITPHGLHWFNGRLYAIVDHYQVTFTNGVSQVFAGDKIVFDDGQEAIVLDIIITSGSWGSGDAIGKLLVKFTDDTHDNSTTPGLADIIRPDGENSTTTIADAITVDQVQVVNSWGAGIYYTNYDFDITPETQAEQNAFLTTNRRWYPLDMGWVASFKTDQDCDGTGIPTVKRDFQYDIIYGDATPIEDFAASQTLQGGYTVAAPLGVGSSTNDGVSTLSTILGDNSDVTWVGYTAFAGAGVFTSGSAVINQFDFSQIPDSATITGFEVTARVGADPASTGQEGWGRVTVNLTGTTLGQLGISQSKSYNYTPAVYAIEQAALGSGTDLWGLDGIPSSLLIEAMKDSTFGLQFTIANNRTGGADNKNTRLYYLSLKVYYRIPVDKLYAYDPSTFEDLEIEIPYYFLETGQFAPPTSDVNGSGTLVIYNIKPLDTTGAPTSADSTNQTILSGREIRTARAGGGDLICKISSDMKAQMLPTYQKMKETNKQFVIFNANYYAQDSQDAFYGASGNSPAFQYDGAYFFFFRTHLAAADDIPSQAAYHRNYLCLGYDAGSVIVSFPGEPTNFDPVAGSTQYATGDRITNLMSLNGTALGIFCESSIHALDGNVLVATDDNDAVMQIISPYSGAIDYTAKDCGIPIFADFRGISTIEATEKYGNFDNGRISYKITPFITERTNNKFSYQAKNQKILFAEIVRNKNQYRLYCADGVIVTCSLPSGERGYEFTKQKYVYTTYADCLVPVCTTSGVTESGVDVIFASFKILLDDDTNISDPSEPQRETFVYRIDRGSRLGSAGIYHMAKINFMSLSQPNDFDLLRNVRFELLTYNYLNNAIRIAADYQDYPSTSHQILIDATKNSIRVERDSSYVVAKVAARGTTLGIEISGEHPYPGHVLQAMMCEYGSGRTQQGASPSQTMK